MKLFFIVFLLQWLLVNCDDPTTTLKTMVWATGTNEAGVTTVTQSAYTQEFSSMYDEVAEPSSGQIGLGSISGNVGDIRSYEHTTVTQQNSACSKNIFGDVGKKGFATPMLFSLAMSLSFLVICFF